MTRLQNTNGMLRTRSRRAPCSPPLGCAGASVGSPAWTRTAFGRRGQGSSGGGLRATDWSCHSGSSRRVPAPARSHRARLERFDTSAKRGKKKPRRRAHGDSPGEKEASANAKLTPSGQTGRIRESRHTFLALALLLERAAAKRGRRRRRLTFTEGVPDSGKDIIDGRVNFRQGAD